MNRKEIGTLWSNELSAIEAYQGTLGAKQWKLGDGDPEIDELFHILVDHVQAASLLGRKFGQLKRMPSVSELRPQGKWSEFGAMAGGLFRDANVFSDKAGLEILKEGEECSLEDYEQILQDTATVNNLRPLIGKLVTKQRAHIRSLSGLMSRL
ncbi:MAG: hypothetical protein ACREXY_18500 [Gammaproteobacteria bacterium]